MHCVSVFFATVVCPPIRQRGWMLLGAMPQAGGFAAESAIVDGFEAGMPSGKKMKVDVIPVLMPQVGNTMEEGTILEWFVSPGESIAPGDVIFEVETDKAAVEVEAVEGGRLARIVAEEGDTVPVKEAVAYLAENDADVDAYLARRSAASDEKIDIHKTPRCPRTTPPEDAAPRRGDAKAGTVRPKASPAARRAAGELMIDLSEIASGSGPGGLITTEDVKQHAAKPAAAASPAQKRLPVSRMRKAVAANLQFSKQNIPHFYTRVNVDAAPLLEHYAEAKRQFALSINDIIVLACSRAAKEFPQMRSRWENDEIVVTAAVDIGIAVATDDGLLVPVLRGAGCMGLAELAAEARRVIEAARAGKLEGAGQGAFTVTNLGMFGVDDFAAIINPGESAILAVGAIREAPVVQEGKIVVGKEMTLTLSADHRFVDGAVAGKFLTTLRNLLEHPEEIDQPPLC